MRPPPLGASRARPRRRLAIRSSLRPDSPTYGENGHRAVAFFFWAERWSHEPLSCGVGMWYFQRQGVLYGPQRKLSVRCVRQPKRRTRDLVDGLGGLLRGNQSRRRPAADQADAMAEPAGARRWREAPLRRTLRGN